MTESALEDLVGRLVEAERVVEMLGKLLGVLQKTSKSGTPEQKVAAKGMLTVLDPVIALMPGAVPEGDTVH